MAKILAPPMTQFVDANGHPYAGGTVETYIPGTTTAKDTWQDHAASALNTNPVVLDASGRAFIRYAGSGLDAELLRLVPVVPIIADRGPRPDRLDQTYRPWRDPQRWRKAPLPGTQ